MDELHLLTAVSYVSLNPVGAGLVGYAADWALQNLKTDTNTAEPDPYGA